MDAVDPKIVIEGWLKRFGRIEADVQNIVLHRHIFRRL